MSSFLQDMEGTHLDLTDRQFITEDNSVYTV